MCCVALAALPGCDRSGADESAVIVVPNAAETPATAQAPPPPSNAAIDHVERVPAASLTPNPDPSPSARMQPRKDFTDPPLPTELKQDGGLKPLPPRPH